MTATLYSEDFVQNSESGEFSRTYSDEGQVSCYAAGVVASGKDVPGTFEEYTRTGFYSSTDMVRMYTSSPIPKDYKVSKITDANGVMWTEDHGDPTIFDSNGSTPVVSARGAILEYVSMLTRSEVQDVSIL